MFEIGLHGIKKYLDSTLVLENIDFDIYDGEKVGIVGANGSGKTTILKLIAGIHTIDRDDAGWISMAGSPRMAYLEQIPVYPEGETVADILDMAFEEINTLETAMRDSEKRMSTLTGTELDKMLLKYNEQQLRFEVLGGYAREEKLSKVCNGLKMSSAFLSQSFHALSGGEKTTVILGKILLEGPDVLLLDEPTNHLDVESIEWLEFYLKNYKGIVIIVSHDRYFLDNVVTKIIEIEDMESYTYKGNYSSFVKQKEENMMIQFEQYKDQQKKIKSMEKAVKDLRDWAIRADNAKFFSRAASIQKRLDKMERINKPEFEKQSMRLAFHQKDRSGHIVIKTEELSKGYQNKLLFAGVDLLITYGERTALLGPNGSGKTTFLKLLLGEETADGGSIKLGAGIKGAYLPQIITFKNEELTVLQCFREDLNILEGKAREYLSQFMFFGSTVFKKVRHLSGGERIRLKLSRLLVEDINLLILDEPTNHLDITAIETMEAALDDFKGTIFFISHDRYFINKFAHRIIAIEENDFISYDGNYDFYVQKKNERKVQLDAQKNVIKTKTPRGNRTEPPKPKAVDTKGMETAIHQLEDEIQKIAVEMAKSSTDYETLSSLHTKHEELMARLDDLLENWINHQPQ